MSRGIFVTFEGGEGTGKTTQLPLVAAWLESLGYEVTTTREPGGTELGRTIRKLLLRSDSEPPVPRAELMLYAADRAQHVEKLILPALKAGRAVLCDRYADATLAYQGYGRGLDLDLIGALNGAATGGVMPERTLWFDIEPALGIERSLKRLSGDGREAESRFEEEELAFHSRVRAGYAAICAADSRRVKRLDAAGEIPEITARIRAALADLFPPKTR